MPQHFKFAVLGGGSAGYAAARTAAQYSDSVAVIDGSNPLGGLCILKGCMPSKTLIYSAEILHLAKEAHTFGLNINNPQANLPQLHARKKEIIADFANYRQSQLQNNSFQLIQQYATLIDPHTLQLQDGQTLTADFILIATGSTINFPPIPGLDSVPSLTSDEILDLDYIPESIIVLGGGVIACELAQFLNRIGSQVIQIQRSNHILKEASPQASSVLEKAFTDQGIELYTSTHLQSIEDDGGQITVHFEHQGKTITKTAKHLFNALGRKPNTHNLGLENAHVELLKSGHIKTNTFQQSSTPHIYAAGDCAGPHEIVHVAILQGECAGHHPFQPKQAKPVHYHDLLKIIFTDPQIAHVGKSEAELQNAGTPYITADYPFDDHGKSILMEAKYGYVKLLADKHSGQILGAECVGKDASELIHSMAVAVTLKATATQLLDVHWYHPTLSEIWTYPLEEIADSIGI